MIVLLDDDDSCFRVRLTGDVRWNDRLALAGLAPALRRTRSATFLLDAGAAVEADRGAFGGVAATARRMALLEGLPADVVPPSGAAA